VREGAFAPLPDDPAADLFTLARAITQAHGRPAYEVSNHASAGEESRHNLAYWRYDDYVGIGPGAHGRRAGPDGQTMATTRHKKPENWLAAIDAHGAGIAEARPLSAQTRAAEALLMGLRLTQGIDLAMLGRRLAVAPSALIDQRALALYTAQGLVWQSGARIGVSEPGMLVLNSLIGELVAPGLVEP